MIGGLPVNLAHLKRQIKRGKIRSEVALKSGVSTGWLENRLEESVELYLWFYHAIIKLDPLTAHKKDEANRLVHDAFFKIEKACKLMEADYEGWLGDEYYELCKKIGLAKETKYTGPELFKLDLASGSAERRRLDQVARSFLVYWLSEELRTQTGSPHYRHIRNFLNEQAISYPKSWDNSRNSAMEKHIKSLRNSNRKVNPLYIAENYSLTETGDLIPE